MIGAKNGTRLVILIGIFLIYFVRCDAWQKKISQPTVVDRALPLLQRGELKRMMGLDANGHQILALENVQYKCQILNALYVYWRTSFKDSKEKIKIGQRLSNLLKDCGNPDFSVSEFFNQSMIFPGTKWCGQANVAEDYNDLGMFNETDSCCRSHDHCEDIIQPGGSKHNLFNPFSTTRLNCECDDTLRRCFRKVNSVVSNTMGYIFFSMLQTQCFKLDHPTLGCELWRRGSVRLYCVQYRKDTSEPKKWQWFDQEPYF